MSIFNSKLLCSQLNNISCHRLLIEYAMISSPNIVNKQLLCYYKSKANKYETVDYKKYEVFAKRYKDEVEQIRKKLGGQIDYFAGAGLVQYLFQDLESHGSLVGNKCFVFNEPTIFIYSCKFYGYDNVIFLTDDLTMSTAISQLDSRFKVGLYHLHKDFTKIKREIKQLIKGHNMKCRREDANVMGNPPYSKGQKLLYTYFFELALDLADMVVFIMPLNLLSNHDKLRKHNKRIHKHKIYISENISEHFNVGMNNIHYIVASNSIVNEVPALIDPLENMDLLLTERKRLVTIKGDTDTAIGSDVENGVAVFDKVYKRDSLQIKRVHEDLVEKSSKWSDAPWLVLVNHAPSKGRFNCVITKNKNMTWTMWIFAFEAQTEEEAIKLKEWLQSDIIIDEINRMFKAKAIKSTISKAMIERLPYYE